MMNGTAFRHYIDDYSMMSNEQLQAAINKFNEVLKKRQEAEREELRIKLMENLQKAIGDVLHNDFELTIQNADDPQWIACFSPTDVYHIEIE